MPCQDILDLPELHPESTDLHLGVEAVEKFERAVATVAHAIPGPIELAARMLCEDIREKSLARELGAVQVAESHAVPPMQSSPGTPTGPAPHGRPARTHACWRWAGR